MRRGDPETRGVQTPILSMSLEPCHNKGVGVLALQPEALLVPNLEDLPEPTLHLQEEGPQQPEVAQLLEGQEEDQEEAVVGDQGLVQEGVEETPPEEGQPEVETHQADQVIRITGHLHLFPIPQLSIVNAVVS